MLSWESCPSILKTRMPCTGWWSSGGTWRVMIKGCCGDKRRSIGMPSSGELTKGSITHRKPWRLYSPRTCKQSRRSRPTARPPQVLSRTQLKPVRRRRSLPAGNSRLPRPPQPIRPGPGSRYFPARNSRLLRRPPPNRPGPRSRSFLRHLPPRRRRSHLPLQPFGLLRHPCPQPPGRLRRRRPQRLSRLGQLRPRPPGCLHVRHQTLRRLRHLRPPQPLGGSVPGRLRHLRPPLPPGASVLGRLRHLRPQPPRSLRRLPTLAVSTWFGSVRSRIATAPRPSRSN
jgi:hypothetical protein